MQSPKSKTPKAPKSKSLKVPKEKSLKIPKEKKSDEPMEIPAELKAYFNLPTISGTVSFNKTLLSKRKTARSKEIIAFFIEKILPCIETKGIEQFCKLTKAIARITNNKKMNHTESLQYIDAYLNGTLPPEEETDGEESEDEPETKE